MCPASKKKRSLNRQRVSSGSKFKNSEYKTCIKSAPPIGPPGWPELAFSTIAAAKIRILSADFMEISDWIVVVMLQNQI